MTKPAKALISDMLKGFYLLPWKRPSGRKCYRLYQSTGNPVRNVRDSTFTKLTKYIDPGIKIFKTDKHGRITLSRSQVRKLRGNHTIKKLYKQTISDVKIPPGDNNTSGQIQIRFKRSL